jgi:hypothetical protein
VSTTPTQIATDPRDSERSSLGTAYVSEQVSRIDQDIRDQEMALKRNTKREMWIVTPSILLFIAAVFVTESLPSLELKFALFAGFGVSFVAAIRYLHRKDGEAGPLPTAASIEELKAKRRVLLALSAGPMTTKPPSYFERLVNINVENLAAYYALVKIHTDKSFHVSLAVGIIGFGLIAIGLALALRNEQRTMVISYIATGSGVITEFIAAVFFYLYNRTVQQMKGYHDSLLSVQNILLSFKLMEDTELAKERAEIVGQMLPYLLNRESPRTLRKRLG